MTLSEGLSKIGKILNAMQIEEKEEEEVLTAEILEHLYYMNSSQLRTIYKNGQRKVRIADDPEAYSYLSHMNSSQLAAIFGDNIPN